MRVCEVIFGRERGEELRAYLEEALGEPCPCSQGRRCPLAPPDVPAPRSAVDEATPA